MDTAQLVRPPSGGGGGGSWPAGDAPCVQSQTVAVKRLKPHVLESEDDVLCFIQEARLLVNLRVSVGSCAEVWGRYEQTHTGESWLLRGQA